MSNLVEHAKRELALLAGDHDMDPYLIRAVEAFAEFGHSGGSAGWGISVLNELLQFKNISPLTDDPDEWMLVSDDTDGNKTYQSRRNPEAFSLDGGDTYYLLSYGSSDKHPWPKFKTDDRRNVGNERVVHND